MQDDRIDPAAALDAIVERVRTTHDAVGREFPYVADPQTGEWTTTPDGNWCGGHWIGLLHLASDRLSGEPANQLRAAARDHTERMDEYMPRESMFCGMNFRYAGFGGYDRTGDRSLFGLGLTGADAMVEYYHEGARQIPLGELAIKGPDEFRGPESDHGPSGAQIGAVDNIYTALPVLWRAYDETGDPTFRDVAVSHADRHLDWYVRADGSTWHHAVFDPETGELERQYNELARSDETCWARGQGWNVAGLCRAYTETGAQRYLDALELTVGYYRDNSPADEVPYWDFAVSGADEPRDTSAAALVAYGLLGLDPRDESVADLRAYGRTVLASLVDDYLVTDPDAPNVGAVRHGCFNRPGDYAVDDELIWTTYYVARTLERVLDA
ncbi:glycoside hydrolase family 88 protein [Halosimplex amylolyticum]|uniref:glycoside hydrolase family 88 protein n=1 Tax=Halosimplex amylolyticum TaxID=3396616 RepID=UPI003F5547A7